MIYLFRSATGGMADRAGVDLSSTIAWSVGLLLFALFLYRRYNRAFTDRL